MNVEQLRMVLEAINSVGGEAKEFGIWFLVCTTVPAVLWFVFGLGLLAVVNRLVRYGVSSWSAAFAIGREMGHVPYQWGEQDTEIVINKIRQLKGR